MRILIVDDMKFNRDLLKLMLKTVVADCVCEFAENGMESIEKIKKDKFDIVFMDIQMPELDGFATTSIIREFDQKTPIVAITAFIGKGYENLCYMSGMNGYVAKPYEKENLSTAIQKIFNGGVENE